MTKEAATLRAEQRNLAARLAEREQQLRASEAERHRLAARIEELTQQSLEPTHEDHAPDRWLAGITDTTTETLRAAQEAAQRLVSRAKERARAIEQAAVAEAAEVRKRADVQSEKLLLVAHYDAEGLLQGAQASAEELLARAKQREQRILAQLEDRRETLQAQIEGLEVRRQGLLKFYAKIRRLSEEAIELVANSPVTAAAPASAGTVGAAERVRRAVRGHQPASAGRRSSPTLLSGSGRTPTTHSERR